MAVILTRRGTKPRFLSPTAFPDYAGNVFLAVVYNQGTDEGTLVELYKRTPAGVFSLVGTKQSSAGKEDGCCITLSGSSVIGFLTAHVGDPETNIQDFAFLGVAVPYPVGHAPIGAPGAFLPVDEVPVTVDYDLIAAKVVAALVREFGGNIRDALEGKAKDAIVELMDYSHPDGKSRQYLDRLAPFVRDRTYEALVAYHGPRNQDDEEVLAALAEGRAFENAVSEMEQGDEQ